MKMNYLFLKTIISILAFSLTACGGGSDDSVKEPTEPSTKSITGGGVKGPLAKAIVKVYAYDAGKPNFKGSVIGTATTDDSASITGLSLPIPLTPPYIMEFTSDANTIDITTGKLPVITTLRTVITQELLNTGEKIYATPLTTMAVDIAIADSSSTTSASGFKTALTAAAAQVVSTVGFGMPGDIDIFDTPPLIDNTTTETAAQADVAAYRTAIEAITAVVFLMQQQVTANVDVDAVLTALSLDLADGTIDAMTDGTASTVINSDALTILTQDVATLAIPNASNNETIADIQAILVIETTTTGISTSTTELTSSGSISTTVEQAQTNADIDDDGVLNSNDAFPNDNSETLDTDLDSIGDNADNCPTISNLSQINTDLANDGGDACDNDDDNDGALDTVDAFPLDANEQVDTDNDGTGNNTDTDDDGDGIDDATENSSGSSADHDGDGIPNREDSDSDNDGVLDNVDSNPYSPANTAPVALSSSEVINEDGTLSFILSFNDDGIPEGGSLTFNISSPTQGSITGAAPNLVYTPNSQYNGTDSLTFSLADASGLVSNSATVSIKIIAVNDAPTITGTPSNTANTASNYSFTPTANDIDGDDLTFSIQNKPSWLTFDTSTGSLTGTPLSADSGNTFSNIIISVSDGIVNVNLAAFNISVSGLINDGAIWDQFNWDDGKKWQ